MKAKVIPPIVLGLALRSNLPSLSNATTGHTTAGSLLMFSESVRHPLASRPFYHPFYHLLRRGKKTRHPDADADASAARINRNGSQTCRVVAAVRGDAENNDHATDEDLLAPERFSHQRSGHLPRDLKPYLWTR
jgi:hypothetical protein